MAESEKVSNNIRVDFIYTGKMPKFAHKIV